MLNWSFPRGFGVSNLLWEGMDISGTAHYFVLQGNSKLTCKNKDESWHNRSIKNTSAIQSHDTCRQKLDTKSHNIGSETTRSILNNRQSQVLFFQQKKNKSYLFLLSDWCKNLPKDCQTVIPAFWDANILCSLGGAVASGLVYSSPEQVVRV